MLMGVAGVAGVVGVPLPTVSGCDTCSGKPEGSTRRTMYREMRMNTDMTKYKEPVIWLRDAPAFKRGDQNIAEQVPKAFSINFQMEGSRTQLPVSCILVGVWH